MARTIHWYEHRAKKNGKNDFQANEQCSFYESYGKWEKHRDVKLVTTEAGTHYLVSEPNYHKTNFYFQNKPGYLGLSILEISKIVMYDFWYDYMKPKYGKIKIMVHGYFTFITYIKIEDIYAGITKDAETRFYTSDY